MIQIRFGDNFIYLETNKLIPSKELLENVKRSHKYHQIVTSIESLGIIEPIIVFYDKDKDVTKILDGHLRVEALKDLGIGLSESFAITLGSMPFITFALSFMASTDMPKAALSFSIDTFARDLIIILCSSTTFI